MVLSISNHGICSDRGYRWMGEKTAHMGSKMVAAGLI